MTGMSIAAIGDSKTLGNACCLATLGFIAPFTLNVRRADGIDPAFILDAQSGVTVQIVKNGIDGWLSQQTATPEWVLVNLGINDVFDGLPPEATWEANMLYILDALHVKWPNAKVRLMRQWAFNLDAGCDTLDSWIGVVVAARPTFSAVGPDERIFLKGSDNGASETSDGLHPNVLGYSLTAAAWQANMGL